eukprot:scaffold10926_cov163-Amphora_coffeaeformis.AAC.7
MKVSNSLYSIGLWLASAQGRLVGLANDGEGDDEACSDITTLADFDLDAYASSKWYVHEQAVTAYLPKENNYCVTAEYTVMNHRTFWGYKVRVKNSAKNINGEEFGGILYAAQNNDEPAKLKVAPGFLPQFLAGPYWILDYQEATAEQEGYALIIGGQPNVRRENGGCATKNRWITSSGGLWIFTRSTVRNQTLIDTLRERLANQYGLDVTVLNPVDHSDAALCGTDGGLRSICWLFVPSHRKREACLAADRKRECERIFMRDDMRNNNLLRNPIPNRVGCVYWNVDISQQIAALFT